MKLVIRYTLKGVRIRRTVDLDRIDGRKDVVNVRVDRRIVKVPEDKRAASEVIANTVMRGERDFEDDGVIRWQAAMRLLEKSLYEAVMAEKKGTNGKGRRHEGG